MFWIPISIRYYIFRYVVFKSKHFPEKENRRKKLNWLAPKKLLKPFVVLKWAKLPNLHPRKATREPVVI